MKLAEALDKMNIAIRLQYPFGDQLRAMAAVMTALGEDQIRVTKEFDELLLQLAQLVTAVKDMKR